MINLLFPFFKSKNKLPECLNTFGVLADDMPSFALGVVMAQHNNSLTLFNYSTINNNQNKAQLDCPLCQNEFVVHLNELPYFQNFPNFEDIDNCQYLILSGDLFKANNKKTLLEPKILKAQNFIVVDSPLLGALELYNLRKELLNTKDDFISNDTYCSVIEISPLFNHVKLDSTEVNLKGLKPLSFISGINKNMTRRGLELLNNYPSKLIPGSNLLERAFANMAGILRPILLLHIINLPKSKQFVVADFYSDADILKLTHEIETELKLILKAYSCSLNTLNKKIQDCVSSLDFYDNNIESTFKTAVLKNAMHGLCFKNNFNVKKAFETMIEDVKLNLILINQLAELASVPLKTIPGAIRQINQIGSTNLIADSRTIDNIGLKGLSHREIIELLNQ